MSSSNHVHFRSGIFCSPLHRISPNLYLRDEAEKQPLQNAKLRSSGVFIRLYIDCPQYARSTSFAHEFIEVSHTLHNNDDVTIMQHSPSKTKIANCYNPYKSASTITYLDQWLRTCNKNDPIVLGGDFNAHHSLWEDTRAADKAGRALFEVIFDRHLMPRNTPIMPTRRHHDGSTSFIDMTLSHGRAQIGDWQIAYDLNVCSDHTPILWSIVLRDDDAVTEHAS